MNDQLVSIITPVYNGEKHLAETIMSVLAQSYENWEMLIVDDGSKDRSAAIAKSFADKDPRIKVICQSNRGCTAARNHGIREASGRYFCLLDSDDLWDPDFLKEQLALLAREHVFFVCAAYRYVDHDSKVIKSPAVPPEILTYRGELDYCHVGCLTAMYDSSVHGKLFLDERLAGYCDDYAYWLQILEKTGPGRGNPKILASYRITSSKSITGNKPKLIIPHFMFHYRYCRIGLFKSLINTIRWGLKGLRKFFFYSRQR